MSNPMTLPVEETMPEAIRAGRFRKRAVVIDAFHFTPPMPNGVPKWLSDAWVMTLGGPAIPTLEGIMAVTAGDWIIRGVKGEVYPCKPDIFAATYEPESAASLPTGMDEGLRVAAEIADSFKDHTDVRDSEIWIVSAISKAIRSRLGKPRNDAGEGTRAQGLEEAAEWLDDRASEIDAYGEEPSASAIRVECLESAADNIRALSSQPRNDGPGKGEN